MKVITDKTPTRDECCYRGKYNTCEFKGNVRWCEIVTDEKCPFCIGFNDFLNRTARDLHDENSD